MSGSRGGKKSEAAGAAASHATSPDTAVLMAAIANSEQNVVAKITALESKVESKCQTLNDMIDSLRSQFTDQIDGIRSEFCAKTAPIDASLADHQERLTSLEEATNTYSDNVVDLEAQVRDLKEIVSALCEKTEDLEGRQRRCNARILGIREHFEAGTRPVSSVAKLLQEVLGLDAAPTLDRAHRSLQPAPGQGRRARPFIIKFHYYQEKMEVLRRAAQKSPLIYGGDKISIFPDLPSSVVKRRGTFKEVKDLLRGCPDVKFGMLYPAKLRITSPLGEKVFIDPAQAKDYVKNQLLPAGDQHHEG